MTVTLSPGAQNFEVTSGDSLVVTGKYSTEDDVTVVVSSDEHVPEEGQLKPDGIYKVS